ncbi:MAG: hypothetical protein LBG42_07375 [Treponema sp.]|jgi:anti-sigma factor RsiW|nr:hypothetical protein [Treponema sp.]
MCPDREIISVYMDGELPSPWKEKLEGHFSLCETCRKRLADYRRLSAAIARETAPALTEEAVKAAGERVMERLSRRRPAAVPRRPSVWRRTITIPLPAAAAAAVLLAILALVWRRPVPGPETTAAGMDLDIRNTVPVSDMDGVLQYLSARDDSDYVILRLPERNFMSAGEPVIIKAADYSGRNGRE